MKIERNQMEREKHLDNAYLLYPKNPSQLQLVLADYVACYREMQELRGEQTDREKILPVILGDGYIDDMLY